MEGTNDTGFYSPFVSCDVAVLTWNDVQISNALFTRSHGIRYLVQGGSLGAHKLHEPLFVYA